MTGQISCLLLLFLFRSTILFALKPRKRAHLLVLGQCSCCRGKMATTGGRFEPKSTTDNAQPLLGGKVAGTHTQDSATSGSGAGTGGGAARAAATTSPAEPIGDGVLSNRMLGVFIVRLADGVKVCDLSLNCKPSRSALRPEQ